MSVPSEGPQAIKIFGRWSCFDEDALERIFLDSRVCKSKVMILSMTGARRSGKSFLLNVFLKYLKNLGKPDWLENPNVPIGGFIWGYSTFTRALYMWSEPFFITIPSGEEVCILLMDAQGTLPNTPCFHFGLMNHLPMELFMISTLLASVLVYIPFSWMSLMDDMQNAISYGKLAFEVYKTKPFQTCYLLFQNGFCHTSHQLKFEAGKYSLMMTECGHNDFELAIHQCFKNIYGFIMHDAGKHVRSTDFCGLLSDEGINADFKTCLKIFTELVFDPKNIIIKEINGKQVTGGELFHYFKSYYKVIDQKLYRDPKSFIQAEEEARKVIESTEEERTSDAIELYRREMNKIMHNMDRDHLNQEILEKYHNVFYDLAMKRLRGLDFICKDEVRVTLLELYDNYVKDVKGLKTELNSPTSKNVNGILAESKKGK